jgi:hypothetical protein
MYVESTVLRYARTVLHTKDWSGGASIVDQASIVILLPRRVCPPLQHKMQVQCKI